MDNVGFFVGGRFVCDGIAAMEFERSGHSGGVGLS